MISLKEIIDNFTAYGTEVHYGISLKVLKSLKYIDMMKDIRSIQFWFVLFVLVSFAWDLHAQSTRSSDNFDALHYEIRIDSINFATQEIKARADVRLTPFQGPVEEIVLDLINLSVTKVSVDGMPVGNFIHEGGLLRIPVWTLNDEDTVTVKVDYQGVPFHESWGGFHFSGEYAFNLGVGISTIPHNLGKSWYPCIDNFTDRATYEVYCTLPAGKMAVCGGVLTETVDNGDGTLTYHWTLNQTIPTYLSSIAVGHYACVSDTFSGMNGQIPIDIYVRPQDTHKVAGTFANLKDILAIFEDRMGPYSWDRVGYTGTAIGAMEHAANIFVPHTTISGNLANEELMAHELTHMWMGDKVTCASAEEMWINEGWATFFGMYYSLALNEDIEGFKAEMRAKHNGVMQYCHTVSGDGSYFPLNQIPQEYTYGMSAYDRGSTVVQALRFYLGDSLFFETVKAFIDAYAFQPADSYEMRDFMSGYTGIDMSGFFDNFVLNSGTPHYSIDSFTVSERERSIYDVVVYVKQKRKGPAFTGSGNIMEVMFMDEAGNRHSDTIHFNGASGVSVKTLTFSPSVILADPEEKMCDATTDNYKTIKTPGNHSFDKTFFSMEVTAVTDSAFIQVTHNWAPPDSLNDPVPGLRLSDYRYWKLEGIIPEGFEATGKFFYSVNGYLDNTLITSSTDTLIMLYRATAADDWQEVYFEKMGPWNVGNIMVPGIQLGEYTLAVRENTVGTGQVGPGKYPALQIIPNPSSDRFKIQFDNISQGELRIFNDQGLLIEALNVRHGDKGLVWAPGERPSGAYYLVLSGQEGVIASGKAVYQR